MKKSDKLIVLFYACVLLIFISALIYTDLTYREEYPDVMNSTLGGLTFSPIENIVTERLVSSNRSAIFDTMANVTDYPKIFPRNILSVQIINKTENVVYANEEFIVGIIKTKLIAKHTLQPYEKHTIEILSGDAEGTVITQNFEEIEGGKATKLRTEINFNLKGVLTPILYFPRSSLITEIHTVLKTFDDRTRGFDNRYEKTVDDLYREILYRPADKQGLRTYSVLLSSGTITEDELRHMLMNSTERKNLLLPNETMTLTELRDDTKKTVNNLYLEILQRPADEKGLVYYSSMIELGKMTEDDVRKSLLESDEYNTLRR